MLGATKSAEARRILDRYIVEVVEEFDLCPWARSARVNGEIAVEILAGAPTHEEWMAAAKRALEQPKARVAMVVAPELVVTLSRLHEIRNRVVAQMTTVGIAEFHPDAPLDLATPARLVPFLRRAPDPLLQLVPLSLLESVRSSSVAVDRVQQLQLLGGYSTTREDIAARIAATNHATVTDRRVEIIAALDAIAADRQVAYARAGFSACPIP